MNTKNGQERGKGNVVHKKKLQTDDIKRWIILLIIAQKLPQSSLVKSGLNFVDGVVEIKGI